MDDNEAVVEKMPTEKVIKSLWELYKLCKAQERPFRYQLSLRRAIRAIEKAEKITEEGPCCECTQLEDGADACPHWKAWGKCTKKGAN